MRIPEIVCHRGANQYAPENTYASTQLCIDWGMDYVEIDVNRSRDGVWYLFHGPTVERTTNGQGHFWALESSEIDRLDAGSWFAPEFAGTRIPRLTPFLEWARGQIKFFIDVKAPEPEELLDIVYAAGVENDCFFWCGDERWPLYVRKLDPNLALKINVSSVDDVLDAHKRFRAQIVELSLAEMSQPILDTCRELGIRVMLYVKEKDPDAYRQVLDWGVDLINLNHGDLFQRVAREYQG